MRTDEILHHRSCIRKAPLLDFLASGTDSMHTMQGFNTASHSTTLETHDAVGKEAIHDKGGCIMRIRQFVCQDVDIYLVYSENTIPCIEAIGIRQ